MIDLVNLSEYFNADPITGHFYSKPPVIKWKELPGLKLQAYVDEIQPRGFERGLRESDMDPIQAWSKEYNCGLRLSFNVWKFRKKSDITIFLLKWS